MAVVVAAATLGAAVAGCGALPPQAPPAYARPLDTATSGISTECGLAYQVTAFPGNHTRNLKSLQDSAITDVRKLVNVFKRNRKWVYQGDTVAEISSEAVSMLESCGLHKAAHELKSATT